MKKILEFLKNTGEKIQNTHPVIQIISFSVCACILFLVLVSFLFHPLVKRSVFYFPDARTGRTCSEIRYLPHTHGLDARLSLYVDELLLGPIHPGYLRLYNKNVHRVTCFVRNHAAYIDISPASPLSDPEVASAPKAFSFFKKNVFTNFKNLDKIYLYLDGIEVYSEKPDADAELKK